MDAYRGVQLKFSTISVCRKKRSSRTTFAFRHPRPCINRCRRECGDDYSAREPDARDAGVPYAYFDPSKPKRLWPPFGSAGTLPVDWKNPPKLDPAPMQVVRRHPIDPPVTERCDQGPSWMARRSRSCRSLKLRNVRFPRRRHCHRPVPRLRFDPSSCREGRPCRGVKLRSALCRRDRAVLPGRHSRTRGPGRDSEPFDAVAARRARGGVGARGRC